MTAKPQHGNKSAKAPPVPAKTPPTLDDIEGRRAKNKVNALRAKMSRAIDNPEVAAQMARYIQNLLREER